MVRLHLNTEDLAKVRISPAWPFTEVCMSIMQLQRKPNGVVDGWRELVRGQDERWGALCLLLPASPVIDLHTVVGPAPTMEQALACVEAASPWHLRQELEPLQPQVDRGPPWARRWVRSLAEGDRQARIELIDLLRDYHERAIAPYWNGVRGHLEAERARRTRVMGEGGVEQLLASLHPRIRWRSPVLEVVCGRNPRSRPDCVSDGRSLVVVPTVFGQDQPYLFCDSADASAPFVLTYPALRDAEEARALWAPHTGSSRIGLALAFGETRARALEVIADTSTTSELAHRLGVALSTASDHAYKLRMARLVTTERRGSAVLHSLTDLGRSLLEGRTTPRSDEGCGSSGLVRP